MKNLYEQLSTKERQALAILLGFNHVNIGFCIGFCINLQNIAPLPEDRTLGDCVVAYCKYMQDIFTRILTPITTKNTSQYINVQVDPISGVYEVRNMLDFGAPLIVDEDEFYRGLKEIRNSMAAMVTRDMAAQIDFEYGIRWLKHTRKAEALHRYEQK